MKKLLTFLILAVLVVLLVGCTARETSPKSETAGTEDDAVGKELSDIQSLETEISAADLDQIDNSLSELETS